MEIPCGQMLRTEKMMRVEEKASKAGVLLWRLNFVLEKEDTTCHVSVEIPALQTACRFT